MNNENPVRRMDEIQKDKDPVGTIPIQPEVDLNNFFDGAGRDEILADLEEFCSSSDHIALITGEEGSGKSMVCKMFGKKAQTLATVIEFPGTVESFDEVIRQIALRNGLEESSSFEQIVDHLVQSRESIILLFDNAEQLYLANLERIRKLLDSVIIGGGSMHLLFAGKEDVLENFDQLSICDFSVSGERRYDLGQLDLEETKAYLNFVAGQLPNGELAGRLGENVAEKIFTVSHGNYKVAADLVQQSLDGTDVESSFMTLLETMKEEGEDDGDSGRGFVDTFKNIYAEYGRFISWGGAALCSLIIIFYLFSGSTDTEEASTLLTSAKQAVSKPVVTVQVPVVAEVTQEKTKPVPDVARPEKPISLSTASSSKDKVVRSQDAEAGKVTPATDRENVETKGVNAKDFSLQANVAETAVERAVTPTQDGEVAPLPVETAIQEVAPLQVQVVERKKEKTQRSKPAIVRINADKTFKVKHTLPTPKIEKAPARENEVKAVITSNAQFTTEQLFQARKQAGVSWLDGGKNNLYTVQLMVLKAKGAERNVKKMLAQKRYRQEAGNFFIFKKKAVPDTIFVFYGEYQDMATARLAQRSIPPFLRAHKPYAVSVKAAVAKIKK